MKLYDIVALLQDLPELNLYRGQVGTIIEEYEPDVFEVEFVTNAGKVYALETLFAEQIILLHHAPLTPDLMTV
ncbi:MAG: DUF4926 domain-containing protein [Cyanobacterium sp. T60_A2020_053]|nr:DUF4926 domain-containing protein [Cyanobacterium sp. T60_A2020_053]